MSEEQDSIWMRRAVTLARRSEGHTRPNPPVGAVVIKRGRLVGEGRHRRAGGAHAEIEALDNCALSTAGATLYVTLEPCSTQGRTPPCTERIIRSGIRRVVIGCLDENSAHGGRGVRLLAERGVEVEQGVLASECRELALPFFKHIRTGMPFLTLKLGMTLDGRIADRAHTSQWITGETARAEVQRMRRRADAIMVGATTVVMDNPSLLCRVKGSGNQMRVVVDGRGKTPANAGVLTDLAASRTIMATTPQGYGVAGRAWQARGAKVWKFAPDSGGRVPLRKLLSRLGAEGLLHVLCEGGGRVAGGLHDAGLVDEYALFFAPAILGDIEAVSGVAGRGSLLEEMPRMRFHKIRRMGEDLLVRIRRD